jgi:hypothetical protein
MSPTLTRSGVKVDGLDRGHLGRVQLDVTVESMRFSILRLTSHIYKHADDPRGL